ncbi:hypothetical protein ASU33_13780 [Solirubrum puertoriconensis]|uniref:Portal protein n=2 Tax=Solirubrum puertoriconensis TaxID=1751427 RepID=A0A9X0L4B2_SOLP1|nr:hypothetical protein ASU33_13780 [Solirubrum puertoriconensis]
MSPDDWVRYGDNNAFPEFLMDSVKKSENHSAFISLRENFIKGAALTYGDDVKPFLESLDEEGTTVEDLWEDWATDMSILETFAALVRYNRTKTAIVAIDYLDSSKVRPSKQYALDKDGNPTLKLRGYWVSADWSNLMQNPAVFYERFNPSDINETTQLHFYHKRANGQPWLPEVSYVSCLNYVQMEDEMSKYGLNTMLNGFFASAILSVTASMTDEQKQAFKRAVRDSFTGSENASKLLVNISETKEGGVEVTPINAGDNTPMMEALSSKAQQAIATAHRCHPALAGVQGNTGFSSEAQLLKSAQEQFQKNVISHLQKPMVAFLKKVLKFNGYADAEFAVEPLNLVIQDIPDWVFLDILKPECAAIYYGYTVEDLRPELQPQSESIPNPASEEVEPELPRNPYPADVA